jgi:signal transduction histidine kinase
MYQKGLEIAKKHQIHKAELYCLNGIGIIYWEQQKYQKALEIFQANLALQKKLGLEKESAASYNNIGLLYNHLHEYEKALDYLFRAKTIREKNNDEERNIATYNNIGMAYLGKKQYDTALNYSLKSLRLAKTFFQKRRIKEATLTIAQIYEAKGDFKNAHSYLKEHKALLDSLEKQDKASIIAEIKRKQDIEARESQIYILQQNHRLKNIIYALAIIFLLVVIIISGFRARKKQKSYNILEQKNLEINNQKGIIEQQNAELWALNENLESLVEERTRKLLDANLKLHTVNTELDTYVYRFAHDFRSPLSTMIGLVNLGKKETDDEKAHEVFDKLQLTLNQMDSLLRKLSALYQIAHSNIQTEEFNLHNLCEDTLIGLCKKMLIARKDIQFSYQGEQLIRGNKILIAICLENILENAMYFSESQPLKISITTTFQGEKAVHIIIEDNGIGIERQYQSRAFEMFFRGHEKSKGNGLGLHVVQKAVEKMEGAVVLQSEPNSFTKVELFLPISSSEEA